MPMGSCESRHVYANIILNEAKFSRLVLLLDPCWDRIIPIERYLVATVTSCQGIFERITRFGGLPYEE